MSFTIFFIFILTLISQKFHLQLRIHNLNPTAVMSITPKIKTMYAAYDIIEKKNRF